MRKVLTVNSESLGQPAWLLTFSDLITLLLTFFVLRYAIAASNNQLSINNTINNDSIVSLSPEALLEETAFNIVGDIEVDQANLIVDRVQENGHLLLAIGASGFQSGTEKLTFEGIVAIKSLAKILIQKNLSASITGFANLENDNIGSHYSQWDLAGARTMAIYRQLVDAKVSPYALSLGSKIIERNQTLKQKIGSDLVRIVIYKP